MADASRFLGREGVVTLLTCDHPHCRNRANIIHNGVKLCRQHADEGEV